MSNRITQLFNTKKNILSVYFTAGYPTIDDTAAIATHLQNAGVDLIEIGFPFSDPLADGPVIQESSSIAIKNGMTLPVLFEQLKVLRENVTIPIILMGYLNPVLQYGEDKFINTCKAMGVDGIIIPDMPLDYYLLNWEQKCTNANLFNILLITPETTDERIKKIDAHSNGFIYMVSSNSITGSTTSNNNNQQAYFNKIKSMNLNNPTLIGFGIHNAAGFENVCKYSSGAIIGSAFIKHLSQNSVSKTSINQFVKTIRV